MKNHPKSFSTLWPRSPCSKTSLSLSPGGFGCSSVTGEQKAGNKCPKPAWTLKEIFIVRGRRVVECIREKCIGLIPRVNQSRSTTATSFADALSQSTIIQREFLFFFFIFRPSFSIQRHVYPRLAVANNPSKSARVTRRRNGSRYSKNVIALGSFTKSRRGYYTTISY